jgi:hypothetical protein
MIRAAPILASLALLAGATAQAESPLTSALEFKLGDYQPQIDSEAGLTGKPYATTFGTRSILLFETEYDRQLFQSFGSLALAFSAGYGEIYGKGYYAAGPYAGQPSGDSTGLKVVPLKVLAVYRFDVLARRFDIPLVPILKAGLVYQLYQITRGDGSVAVDSSGQQGQGARAGYEGDIGLAFLLDWLDEPLAKDFDIDVGINHTYIFGEFRDEVIDGFGTPGLVFSDRLLMFGLALEF